MKDPGKLIKILGIDPLDKCRPLLGKLLLQWQQKRIILAGAFPDHRQAVAQCGVLCPELIIFIERQWTFREWKQISDILVSQPKTSILCVGTASSRTIDTTLRMGARGFIDESIPLELLETAIRHTAEGNGCVYDANTGQLTTEGVGHEG